MRQPIESVLREIDSLPEALGAVTVEVPDQLSLRGNSVPQDIALSIVVDRLLTRGYEPDSIEASDGVRIFRCKPVNAG
jgi:hypothetical protein